MSDNLDDVFGILPKKKNETAQPAKVVMTEEYVKSAPTTERETKDAYVDEALNTDNEISYSPARTNNYATIKGIAAFFKLCAWLFGIGFALSLIGIFQALSNRGIQYGAPVELLMVIGLAVSSLLFTILFSFSAEGVNVILDIEANSRQAAKTLEKILRSQ